MVHIIPSKSFQLELEEAVHLVTRASESNSSESDRCKHSDNFECQKPVNDNTITITVAVVVPVVVISLILGYFLLRNYRKDKKEAMEHDPDFDENGEATALPDFPSTQNFHQNMYQIEDPFHNRNSIRYPIAQAGKGGFNKSTASIAPSHGDPYLDNFVLPYHHEAAGSKVSLDDYARQFGADNPNYFHHTPTASISRTRNSSFSHLPPPGSQNISPQKSSLRQVISTSPTKNAGNNNLNYQQQHQSEYANIPNQSSATLDNEKTEYESNSSDNHSGNHAVNEKYGSVYDKNNNSEAQFKHESFETATSEPTPVDHVQDEHEYDRSNEAHSPFEEEHAMTTSNTTAYTVDTKSKDIHHPIINKSLAAPAITITNGNDEDGDFDFSMSNENSNEDEGANTSKSELLGPSNKKKILSKSPRISAFNLLKNDSDIEDDDDDVVGQEGDKLTTEQEEEIKRMKSVYKVYFENKDGQRQEYPIDSDQPLPDLDQKDIVRINKELKMDTNYEKRMTATSSLYNETPIFSQNEQDFYYNQQQQQPQYFQPQPYGYPVEGHYYQQGYAPNLQQPAQAYHRQDEPSEPLPPLQKLRNPSDFRKSTLETYTNFEPRLKNTVGPNGSPTSGKPFNPIDSDVWTSPVNSPHMQSQASFSNQSNSNNTYYSTSPQLQQQAQQQQQQQQINGSAPSASQLARSSVVMLNPVTEITKQRKFKPAGSLNGNQPGVGVSGGQGQYDSDFSENDLIPGNRKSDVRRMMNTNF